MLPAAAAALVLALSLNPAGPAGAQTAGGRPLMVRSFDGGGARGEGLASIDFSYTGAAGDVPGLQITENGNPVSLTAAPSKSTRDRGIVFVLDSGKGMERAEILPAVRDTILEAVKAHPGVEYGIVQAGDRADIRAELTREVARLDSALRSIGPTEGSAVWNAVNLAGTMIAERGRLQPNIVLVTADDDTVNPQAAAVARATIAANAVLVQTIAFGGAGTGIINRGPYQALAETYGAPFIVQPDRDALESSLSGAVSLVADQQFRASWRSAVPAGEPLHIEVSLGGQTDAVDVLAGRGLYQGYQQLHPELGAQQVTLPLTDNKVALALALLLVLGAVAGIAYAVTTSLVRVDLSNVLQPYADAYGLIEGDTEESGSFTLTKSAFVKKAVAITEQVAENQGMLTRVEGALERANLPLRAAEALFFYLVVALALTVVPLLLTRSVVPALVGGLLGALVPVVVVSTIARKRRKSFMTQLPDMLSLLSGTLKAGYSLMQGVEAVSQEVSEPMGYELRRVVTESRLGRPLEDSLDSSAERMESADFSWAIMAIRIQREVGGNLAELLLTVADTMIARERLRRDVAALTAEGRVSAYLIGGLPPVLTLVMYTMNKEYVSTLFTETMGLVMVGIAVVSMIIGFIWMKKTITIEI